MEAILIPLGLFAGVVLVVYIYYNSRNKERLALINRGEDASIFDTKSSPFPTLKLGMFLAGTGLGVLVADFLAYNTNLDPGVAFLSMLLLFGGGSLIIFYIIEQTSKKTTNKKIKSQNM